MKTEYRKKIESLQTNNSHLRMRVAELTAEVERLRKVRLAASIYLDTVKIGGPSEKQFKVLDYLVRVSEIENGQVLKRTAAK